MQKSKVVADSRESASAAAFEPAGKKLDKKSLIIIIISAALVVISVTAIILAVALTAKPDTYRVEMDVKDFGTIRMTLDRKSAPITVDRKSVV